SEPSRSRVWHTINRRLNRSCLRGGRQAHGACSVLSNRTSEGPVIFETSLHVNAQVDSERRLGRLAPFHPVGFKASKEVAVRLGAMRMGQMAACDVSV